MAISQKQNGSKGDRRMKDRQITGVIYDDGEVVPCAEPVQVVRETELAQKREYFKKKEEKEIFNINFVMH